MSLKMGELWEIKKYERILKKSLNVAVMSEELRNAIEEILQALKKRDWNLSYELTAVKSYISGDINDITSRFREDEKYNEKVLGNNLYTILDLLHHEIAFLINKIPSGSCIVTSKGYYTKKTPKNTSSPTLRLIKKEHEKLWGRFI